MDKEEALNVAKVKLLELRKFSYTELQRFLIPESVEVTSENGSKYQVEVHAFWDDKKGSDLRVTVSVDNFGILSSIFPMSLDFIISSDGTYVGE